MRKFSSRLVPYLSKFLSSSNVPSIQRTKLYTFSPTKHGFSTYFDVTSYKNPDPSAAKPRKPSDHQSRFGLVHLQKNPGNSSEDEGHDEFAADVEKIYRALKKFHPRAPKLDLALQELGITMRPGLTERVLNRCGDAGNLGYSFFQWTSRQPGYRHSYDVYKAMIKILGKMRHFGAVWALLDEMRRESPELISPDLFVVLMRRFASTRMVQKAIQVLDEMPKYGCEPDEYVFGCLLDALCKNGSVKEAASLFEEMRYRFVPSIKHFTSLLYGWCKEGKLIEAKHVLVQMKESGFDPDTVVFNNLLSGYVRAQKMADAYDLLKQMKLLKGCEPNSASYTTLIQGLCSQDKMEEAIRVLVDMERRGCKADEVTYTTLISGFCKNGKLDKSFKLLDTMMQNGCNPTPTTYLYIILALEKNQDLEECSRIINQMVSMGLTPDVSIFNVVIRLAFKLGDVEVAVRVWNQIEGSGLSPGVDSFIIFINGFISQGDLIRACEYFKQMVERGMLSAPHYGILKDLLNSLLRADKLELAKDVWSCMANKLGCELNVSAWTIWIHALFAKGHVKEACGYCMEMMDGADLMPQPDTFAKLMKGLRKIYNREFAAEITEKVRKMAEERNTTFKMYKRRGERDLKEKAKGKVDGRKRRARRRRWGGVRARAQRDL